MSQSSAAQPAFGPAQRSGGRAPTERRSPPRLGPGRRLGAFVVGTLAAALLACSNEGGASAPGRFRGVELLPPVPVPDFTLTATDGRAYHVKAEIDGAVALFFFGYTHCPDVCPVHMANLAAALRDVPLNVSQRVRVIFVTVDPARDQPARLRAWLNNFDPTFVGLRGSAAQVNRIQTLLHLAPTVVEAGRDTSYRVGHNAALIAVIGDSARVLYPFGTRQVDWLHDLPNLVATIPRGARP